MTGAVQLGLLAACIVLFVPMGMAGWHLSRNKMLFFSCALFITLAVGVHLMPYFPLIPAFLSPSQVISAPISSPCLLFLHNVTYSDGPFVDNHEAGCQRSWDWIHTQRVAECDFQKLKKSDASDLLNGSWVVFAGDSQARLMAVSLLELVLGPKSLERVRGELFKRHSNYSTSVAEIGMKLDFIWAPYVENLSELMLVFKRKVYLPDVLVMGAGLWDMLHSNSVSEYGASLRGLRNNVLALFPVSSNMDLDDGGLKSEAHLSHLFWIGMPTLVTSMLNTDTKRERMTGLLCSAYENEVKRSRILHPLLKLDIGLLSDLCGRRCTADGMHYDGIVYDAAIQIMLNALLIESDQR